MIKYIHNKCKELVRELENVQKKKLVREFFGILTFIIIQKLNMKETNLRGLNKMMYLVYFSNSPKIVETKKLIQPSPLSKRQREMWFHKQPAD